MTQSDRYEIVKGKVIASNESSISPEKPAAKSKRNKALSACMPSNQARQKSSTCNQEEKVILFVGCTQNGKSSLIRSILQYGGYEKEAAAIEVGIGNDSTTKKVSSYKVVINIKSHILKDEHGQTVHFLDDYSTLYEFRPSTLSSGHHIHLLLIDTPGLDDSDNSKEAEKQDNGQVVTSGSQMRTVDEKHKLAVLQALGAVKKVHAVCFVISLQNTLGRATQDLTREYISIFEQSNLNAAFHFAHTYVNQENMFDEKTLNRPVVLEETFGLRGRNVKHHYIDNVALEGDPISEHFANLGIARLLESLESANGQPTTSLRYPKATAHLSMDRDLSQSIDTLQRSWQREISLLEDKISELEASKAPLDAAGKVLYDSWSKLSDQIRDLDTESLWPIGSQELSESFTFLDYTWLHFGISTQVTIRDIDVSKRDDAVWEKYPSGKGTKYCSGVLKSSRGRSVFGSIKLWGWKKEAKAEELRSLRRERDEVWSDYKATLSKIENTNSEIENIKKEIETLSGKITELQVEKCHLQLEYIPIEMIRSNACYFGTPDVLSYSLGHGMKRQLPTGLLPRTNISSEEITKRCMKEELEFSDLVKLCSLAVKGIQADSAQKLKIKNQLLELKVTNLDEIAQVNARIKSGGLWSCKTDISTLSEPHRAEAVTYLQDLALELEPRLRYSHASITAALQEEHRRLEEKLGVLRSGISKVEELLKGSRQTEAKWVELQAKHKQSLEAVKMMKSLLSGFSLQIGAFTIVRTGINDLGEDSQEPWIRLVESLKTVYECDADRFWDAFSTPKDSSGGSGAASAGLPPSNPFRSRK